MTTFVNIRLTDPKHMIDPNLKGLLDKLVMVNPKLVFQPQKDSAEFDYVVTYSYGKKLEADYKVPEGFKYLRTMLVYEDNEKLGWVGVDSERNSDSFFVYLISNWRIDKSRGRRNTTTTKKIDVAVREAKKAFKKRNALEAFTQGESDAKSGLHSALRDIRHPFNDHFRDRDAVQLIAYCLANNMPFSNQHLININTKLKSPEFDEIVQKYLLAGDIAKADLYAVVDVGGRFAYKTMVEGESDAQLVTRTFDELPQGMQDKIAVLQLMNNAEIVRDVGFRYKSNIFLLIQ